MIKDLNSNLKEFNFFITHSKDDTTIKEVGVQLVDLLNSENETSRNKDESLI